MAETLFSALITSFTRPFRFRSQELDFVQIELDIVAFERGDWQDRPRVWTNPNTKLRVFPVPPHTPGLQCLYLKRQDTRFEIEQNTLSVEAP